MRTADHVTIVAEAGVNHNGELDLALRLVDSAADAGADVVKFQTFIADRLVTSQAAKAEYQYEFTGETESQLEMLTSLQLSKADQLEISDYCRGKDISFASTAFDEESVDFLATLDMPFFKIPSGEITNLLLIRHIARLGAPVILSTGASTLQEVNDAVDVLQNSGTEKITLLHCTSAYPAEFTDVNLRAMKTMGEALKLPYGYSDHTRGIEISIGAVALGARVIEKHLTLDRDMTGPDHKASIEPNELKAMVDSIRNIELALGSAVKAPRPAELTNIPAMRRSIVAARKINAGEEFSSRNLAVRRPGGGRSPMEWDNVLGSIALRDYQPEEWID